VDIVFNQEDVDDSSNKDGHETANVCNRADLTPSQRQQIYEALLESSVNGKLRRNNTNRVAKLFDVH
jgi:Spy/CpxP family protein refolding chaperone